MQVVFFFSPLSPLPSHCLSLIPIPLFCLPLLLSLPSFVLSYSIFSVFPLFLDLLTFLSSSPLPPTYSVTCPLTSSPPFLFCHRFTTLNSQNIIELSVHLLKSLLEMTLNFLEQALASDLPSTTLNILGSSFVFSTLLPTTLAQLGHVACKQPKVEEAGKGE